MLPEPPLMSGRASTARRGLTGMIKPAPTRLASASRAAKRARVTSGPSALARAKASGRDSESGAAAYTGRVTKQLETTAHVTQTKDARARLKRNFKAEPPGKRVDRRKKTRRSLTKTGTKTWRKNVRGGRRESRSALGFARRLPFRSSKRAKCLRGNRQMRGGRSSPRAWLDSARSAADALESAAECSPWQSTRMRGCA